MNKGIAVVACVGMCFFIYLFDAVNREERSAIPCKANISYFWNTERFDLLISQDLHNGNGFLSLSGIFYSGETKSYLNKTVSFSFHQNKLMYNLKSEIIMDSPQMTMTLSEERMWLPKFFINKDENLLLKIRPYGKNAWLFYAGTVPLFICERY